MGRLRKLKLSVDLGELFGISVDNKALRQAIGGRIIEKIVERTQKGESLSGGAFKPYSKAYKESLEFKVHGKSNTPDLTLTGDMLASLDIIDENSNRLTIGFNDSIENAKAFNHNTGDTLPKREFFGITDKELDEVKTEFEQDVLDFAEIAKAQTDEVTVRVLNRLINENDNG